MKTFQIAAAFALTLLVGVQSAPSPEIGGIGCPWTSKFCADACARELSEDGTQYACDGECGGDFDMDPLPSLIPDNINISMRLYALLACASSALHQPSPARIWAPQPAR
ncbi:hypothetical protein EDC01DRAFT_730376 [Geopyxis carbonaria]|nr:hypothetical protein EDC01DRAFT_730376 [Geopyxis carbonaria]